MRKEVRGVNRIPKVTLQIEGLDELRTLLEKATAQADELRETIEQIDVARLTLQAKINQPSAATNG